MSWGDEGGVMSWGVTYAHLVHMALTCVYSKDIITLFKSN